MGNEAQRGGENTQLGLEILSNSALVLWDWAIPEETAGLAALYMEGRSLDLESQETNECRGRLLQMPPLAEKLDWMLPHNKMHSYKTEFQCLHLQG